MRDPASTRGPASNRSFTVYVHVYEMNTRQRTKGGTYINTTVQLQQFRCNSDVSFPILGYLNRAKIYWAMGDWGGGGLRGPPLNTPMTLSAAMASNLWHECWRAMFAVAHLGCVVECRICNREAAGSNLGLGYFAPSSGKTEIPYNTCHTWALLRWWFTTKRRYIKCTHLLPLYAPLTNRIGSGQNNF